MGEYPGTGGAACGLTRTREQDSDGADIYSETSVKSGLKLDMVIGGALLDAHARKGGIGGVAESDNEPAGARPVDPQYALQYWVPEDRYARHHEYPWLKFRRCSGEVPPMPCRPGGEA